MKRLKCDHIKRLITLTIYHIKRLSLYLIYNRPGKITFPIGPYSFMIHTFITLLSN